MKKKIFVSILMVFGVLLYPDDPSLITHLNKTVKASGIFELVETLALPEYEGRLTGTGGYNKAVRLAADYFKRHGVLPVNADGTYTQSFPVNYTKVHESTLTLYLKEGKDKAGPLECEYFKDYYPLGFSGSGDVKGEVVFAGNGVTAPEFGYDDYSGIDVKGKIVMVVRGVPKKKKGEDWLPYDTHRFRTKNARDHGASALIYIYAARGNPNGFYLENFPMVSIEQKVADRILKTNGKDVESLKQQLKERKNVSFKTGITAHVFVRSENVNGTAHNVVGYIPGSDDSLKDEFVVMGAHLDHCGMWPALTPGADDNGSGSAVLMTIGKALAAYEHKPKRSLLFILFAGEEMGLLGSRYFAGHPPAIVKKIKFVFNMDMVGAGPDMFVMRLKNYPKMEKIITAVPGKLDLTCRVFGNKVTGKRRPGADHAPFVLKGIPAVSVFSHNGHHHGYHKNEDTIYWITPKIMESIAKIIAYTAMRIAG